LLVDEKIAFSGEQATNLGEIEIDKRKKGSEKYPIINMKGNNK